MKLGTSLRFLFPTGPEIYERFIGRHVMPAIRAL